MTFLDARCSLMLFSLLPLNRAYISRYSDLVGITLLAPKSALAQGKASCTMAHPHRTQTLYLPTLPSSPLNIPSKTEVSGNRGRWQVSHTFSHLAPKLRQRQQRATGGTASRSLYPSLYPRLLISLVNRSSSAYFVILRNGI
ncbi:hypothetical protein EV361DRAFT_445688 [Lentinula raphanica]|nr:hypothetical protein EV361DRAFT_445688 [Lentinula raphanica]